MSADKTTGQPGIATNKACIVIVVDFEYVDSTVNDGRGWSEEYREETVLRGIEVK